MLASPAMQQAAYAYVLPHLQTAIVQFVPPFYQYEVEQKLSEPQFQQALRAIINGGLEAALAKEVKPVAPAPAPAAKPVPTAKPAKLAKKVIHEGL